MKNINKLFLDNSIVSYHQILESGYTKYQIKKLCDQEILLRVIRDQYNLSNELEDNFLINQQGNQYMIYSDETALYLHNLCDRYPSDMSVTTKSGYHLRNQKLKVYYVKEEALCLGVERSSPLKVIISWYMIKKERSAILLKIKIELIDKSIFKDYRAIF